jgi:hypothetical protein
MNESDRAWAGLTDAERDALRRGAPLPSEAWSGVVVRDVSHQADRVFAEVRRARGPVAVARIEPGARSGGPRRPSASWSSAGCCVA